MALCTEYNRFLFVSFRFANVSWKWCSVFFCFVYRKSGVVEKFGICFHYRHQFLERMSERAIGVTQNEKKNTKSNGWLERQYIAYMITAEINWHCVCVLVLSFSCCRSCVKSESIVKLATPRNGKSFFLHPKSNGRKSKQKEQLLLAPNLLSKHK